jgi:hypothetical protein
MGGTSFARGGQVLFFSSSQHAHLLPITLAPMAAYLPTPEEIAAACAEIRRNWPPNEHYRRQGIVLDDDQTHRGTRRIFELTPELAQAMDAS